MNKIVMFSIFMIAFGSIFSRANENNFNEKLIIKDFYQKNNMSSVINKRLTNDSLFIIDDKEAEFPNGEVAFSNYLKQNLIYPNEEKINGVTGTVYIAFTINELGNIEDVKIIRGLKGFPNIDNEALRLIKNMPKWSPSIKNGKPIKTSFSFPVKFTL